MIVAVIHDSSSAITFLKAKNTEAKYLILNACSLTSPEGSYERLENELFTDPKDNGNFLPNPKLFDTVTEYEGTGPLKAFVVND